MDVLLSMQKQGERWRLIIKYDTQSRKVRLIETQILYKMMDIKFLLFTMLFVHGLCSAGTLYEKEDPKPNIIVFLVDDLGWQDISAFPNFKKLARSGVQFSDAYATPLCTPTRVSLLTGTNAARHRVTNWTHPDKDRSTDHPDTIFHAVDWNIN